MLVADLLIGDILLGAGLPLATFALGTAMAGFAGVLVAPVFAIDPQLGSRFIIKAFAVIIVGGTAVIPARSIAALIESYNRANGVNLLVLVVAVVFCRSNQAMHFHRAKAMVATYVRFAPILLKSRKYCQDKILAKACRRKISSEDAFFKRRRRSPKASLQVDVVHHV